MSPCYSRFEAANADGSRVGRLGGSVGQRDPPERSDPNLDEGWFTAHDVDGRGRRLSSPGETGEENDAALVAAITAKRPDAVAVAYRQHAHAIFDLSRCIVRDRALAEDVVQDVFVRLWDHPERFESRRGSLRAYLLTLAYGRSVDVARSETARHRREQRQAQLAAAEAATDESFDEQVAREDALHTALSDLR